MNSSPFTSATRRNARNDRRGNTLILVTAILVLLVIIATAYISRAQGVRAISSAQRNAVGRQDRIQNAAGVIANEIASGLFPKLIGTDGDGNTNDPGQQLSSPDSITPFIATSSTPRYKADVGLNAAGGLQPITRHAIDPYWADLDNDGLLDTPAYPYNYAPYETRAWTNWPDAVGTDDGLAQFLPGGRGNPGTDGRLFVNGGAALGDDNPLGNPGFGDFRILRSTEPRRAYDGNGLLTGYTHWPHLSFPATAENGWRVCFDIKNIAPYDPNNSDFENPTADPSAGFTIDFTAAEAFRNGATGYLSIDQPVALQTPYEQWLPTAVPAFNALNNEDLFLQARNRWFGAPQEHFIDAMTNNLPLPNFIRLKNLNSGMRDVVERTYADSDGDGFTDAFWFLLPGTSEDGIRQVAAVSVVDNASMVDVNVATRFDPQSTAGTSPADVALTSRPIFEQLSSGNVQCDPADTWTGLFSDPQNIWPGGSWGFSYANDLGSNAFDNPDWQGFVYTGGGSADTRWLRTAYDPLNFGDKPSESTNWLREVGILNEDEGASGEFALEAPYRSVLAARVGGQYSWLGDFDRRRYFRGRQVPGSHAVYRDPFNDLFSGHIPRQADGSRVDQDDLFAVPQASRGFGNNDELELRMFAGANYSPALSHLERTVNRPWAWNYNLFRSSRIRDENYSPRERSGDAERDRQLTAMQLLRDTRHRATTYSATRNDLRPLWLRATNLYDDGADYYWGRALNSPWSWDDPVMVAARRAGYEQDQRKFDLRAPLDAPLSPFESWVYFAPGGDRLLRPGGTGSPVPSWDLLSGFELPGSITSANDPSQLVGQYWNTQQDPFGLRLALDRGLRFRTELQQILDRTMTGFLRDSSGSPLCQSWLGNSFDDFASNQIAFIKTRLLDASWAANIDTFRDNQSRGVLTYNFADAPGGGITQPLVEYVNLDQPIYPDWAPRVSRGLDNENPIQELDDLTFIGNEAQPFIMEAFFALVYPKSKMTSQTKNRLRNEDLNNNGVPDFDIPSGEGDWEYEIPFLSTEEGGYAAFNGSGFHWVDRESKPAIVFAIQLGNPYDKPVGLQDIRIKIGENSTPLNLSRLPCPHPGAVNDPNRQNPYYRPGELFLGPTKPEAPRSAIVFGIIPPDGYIGDTTGEDFEDAFDQSFADFHQSWVDFLDLEPGNLYGYEPGMAVSDLQTLVFDASPTTFHKTSPNSAPTPFDQLQLGNILSKDPEKWFGNGTTPVDRSVELWRCMQNPLTFNPDDPAGNYNQGNLRICVIDRLDNEVSGSKTVFSEQLSKLHEGANRPTMAQAYDRALNKPDNSPWNGIHIDKDDDFLVSWVRAGRAWGWDVNRNGVYDMNETSPRYIFPEVPKKDWAKEQTFGVETSARGSVGPSGVGGSGGSRPSIGGPPRPGQGGSGSSAPSQLLNAGTYAIGDDPDGSAGGTPWFTRSYFLPLATRVSATGIYPFEFDMVRAKPVRFSTATPLVANNNIDYDAGFPVLPNGAIRTSADLDGWPGQPAGNYRWVMMDKGSENRDTNIDPINFSDRNGDTASYSRMWVEKDQWAYPLQMLQKDADFEQVGEVANTFLWGHALKYRPGFVGAQNIDNVFVIDTVATFGEIMNGIESEEDLFPVTRVSLPSTGPLPAFNASRGIAGSEDTVENAYPIELVHTNRWFPDNGNMAGQSTQPGGGVPTTGRRKLFRPFTQSIEVSSYLRPWTPSLPAGTGLFDALVCDGAGANSMVDITGNSGAADQFASSLERLANEDARFDLAGGFSGRPTRGLINVNTASPEVLRTLPQMSRLAYNTRQAWAGTFESNTPLWVGFSGANPTLGDVTNAGVPRGNPATDRNPQWIRVPEIIQRYRNGESFGVRSEQMNGVIGFGDVAGEDVFLTNYVDRGTVNYDILPGGVGFDQFLGESPYLDLGDFPGFFPGMRRGSGIASVGELALMSREGFDGSGGNQPWPSRAMSIRSVGKDPYACQLDIADSAGGSTSPWVYGAGVAPFDPSLSENFELLGLGWRPYVDGSGWADGPTGQADARLATDRQHTRFGLVQIPDNVAMDAEESNLLFSGISNLVSTRSDTFTVYLKVRSFKQNPVTGVWDATDPEFLVDDSRYVMVVDRSRCEVPSDEPEIRFLTQVPN